MAIRVRYKACERDGVVKHPFIKLWDNKYHRYLNSDADSLAVAPDFCHSCSHCGSDSLALCKECQIDLWGIENERLKEEGVILYSSTPTYEHMRKFQSTTDSDRITAVRAFCGRGR